MLVDMITETTRRNVGGGYFKTKQLHRNFHTIIQSEFCLLDDIYKYTGQSGVADTMVSRHRNFLYSAQHSHNVVVRNLATAVL